MNKARLRDIVFEQKRHSRPDLGVRRERLDILRRHARTSQSVIITGIRRAGKSTLMRQLVADSFSEKAYEFTFEDERLLDFSPEDFNTLYECLVERDGTRHVFALDEIQNAPGWESFVRRMQDRGFKFLLTGSNASLLSRELGTKLTGRSIISELGPFSFREFLAFHEQKIPPTTGATQSWLTEDRALLKRWFQRYMKSGGMPEFLKYKEIEVLKRLYEDILYRDIVTRHDIRDVRALRELGLYFLSHVGSKFSFNKLKSALGLGSVTTVRHYLNHFTDSYLLQEVNQFSYSLKEQFVAPKKVYAIDNGVIEAVAFQFSENRGKFLENLAYVELRRRSKDLFFYKTKTGKEVDFVIRAGRQTTQLIQVTEQMSDADVREREISALTQAMTELKVADALILTEDHSETISVDRHTIVVKPAYQWLLE